MSMLGVKMIIADGIEEARMKTVVAILVTALISFGGAFWLVTRYKNAQIEQERLAIRKAAPPRSEALVVSTNLPGKAGMDSPTAGTTNRVPEGQAAARLALAKLTKLKPTYGTGRIQTTRQIIHQFETLVDLGYDSLPVIKEFLSRFEDVDYSAESARPPDAGGVDSEKGPGMIPGWARGKVRGDSLLPPSLRLGLVDVLRTIGGGEAQKVLAGMLSTTGRGVEVAYTARALQEMAPNQYRDLALTVAKDLLNNPPKIEHPNRLDENSKAYLFEVLAMYNDHSFAGNIQTQLVNPNGQLDRTALDYLAKSLKERALPNIHEAFQDRRITNHWDRAALVNVALAYVGPNLDANNMFADIVTNNLLPLSMRTMAIQNVLGTGQNRGGMDAQTVDNQLLTLFETIRGQVSEDQIARTLDAGIESLNHRVSGGGTNAAPQGEGASAAAGNP
jgi:hypothetical protein